MQATAAQAATTVGPKPSRPPSGNQRSSTLAVSAIEIAFITSVASVTAKTARNLPNTMSPGRQGAMRSVSIVPRSFSPAMASMAG